MVKYGIIFLNNEDWVYGKRNLFLCEAEPQQILKEKE